MIELIHPTGNQFVRNLLEALNRAGLLNRFYTTLAFKSNSPWPRLLPSSLRAECERRTYSLPDEKLSIRPWRDLTRLTAQRFNLKTLLTHETGWASIDRVYQDLDQSVALRFNKSADEKFVKGVYGYEDGCLQTFREAKKRGVITYYDLPIAFWKTTRQLLEEEARRLPEWEPTLVGTRDSQAKFDRKTEELALADVIICPSQFACRSLPTEVRQAKRCVVAEFGSPPVNQEPIPANHKPGKKFRALFAGSMSQRKGLADVFQAMHLLKRSDVELVVMGNPIAPMEFYRRAYGDFIYEPPRPHGEVLKLMRSCDVLVLPSIVEGRALVQQEALSNGVPLIVTANAGGEDLIVEGETGFLVSIRSPEKIAEKLSWMADHREELAVMQEAAKRKASEYPWSRYCDRILDVITSESSLRKKTGANR